MRNDKSVKHQILSLFPKKLQRYLLLYLKFKTPYYKIRQHKRIKLIKGKGYANVLFIASSLAMWRYQEVYKLMCKEKCFKTMIIILPYNTFSEHEKARNVVQLKNYFKEQNIKFTDGSAPDFDCDEWIKTNNPDIIFYPQQYGGIFGNAFENNRLMDRLVCQIPYALDTIYAEWIYNTFLTNNAWKLFYQTEYHLNEAKSLAANQAKNVEVVGEPHMDEYKLATHVNPWKDCGRPLKKVIWAPHFSINDNPWLHRPGFLELAEPMLKLAKDYEGRSQFAFKPHPRLKSELYNAEGWGKEKTDAYYQAWADLVNGQVETGSFIDLFYHSDAMIHNCGSFTAEYIISGHPVMFFTHNVEDVRSNQNSLGKDCLDCHYIGQSIEDIQHFIEETVIKGYDPKEIDRRNLLKKYFHANDKTTAERVVESIKSGLCFN